MRRSFTVNVTIVVVCLGFFAIAPAARAGTTNASGAPGSVTITGPNPATMLFPFARTGDTAYDVWVHYKTEDGTAVAGTDYVAKSGAFQLAAGAATAALSVVALGSEVNSPDLDFTLDLFGAVGVGPTPSFAASPSLSAGIQPQSAVTADVNGDGKLDLIEVDKADNTVSVFLNTTVPGAAAASFAPRKAFTVGTQPWSLAVADVNGDGKPDLIVANEISSTVSVLINTTVTGAATANFAGAVNFAVGSGPRSVTVADVNGDGKPDLVTANYFGSNVSVLLNTTAPGAALNFDAAVTVSLGAGVVDPVSIAAADLNGDGKPDLVTANTTGTVKVLMNTTAAGASSPAFDAPVSFYVGNSPMFVTAADVNGDGHPDLVVAKELSSVVAVLLNTTVPGAAAPSFAAPVNFSVGASPRWIVVTDLNGDGKPDLVVANYAPNSISVLVNATLPGAATPSFVERRDHGAGQNPTSVAAVDLNGDGKPDLMVTDFNGPISVFVNTTTAPTAAAPSFAGQESFNTGEGPVAVTAADLNGDGRPDLLAANGCSCTNTVSVLVNTTAPGVSSPSFATQQTFTVGSSPLAVTTADVNGDGKPDLIAANSSDDTVSVLLNTTAPGPASTATPSFAPQQTFTVGTNPDWVAAADVNGDGRPDLVVANLVDDNVSVLLNTTVPGPASTTTPSFAPQHTFSAGASPAAVATADVNGDGRPDLVVANLVDDNVSVLLNTTAPGPASTTTPSFAPQQIFTVGTAPVAVAAADVNGDGKPDIITANSASDNVSVLLNTTVPGPASTTTPSFAPQQTFAVGVSPTSVTATDVNGDGRPDLVASNALGDTVSVLLNTTVPGPASTTIPSFATQQVFTVGATPLAVIAADINGDGSPDFAVVNGDSDTVSVLLNSQYTARITPADVTGTIHFSMPDLAPLPGTLGFGAQTVGGAGVTQTVTLGNCGCAGVTLVFTLAITGPAASDYSEVNNCPNPPNYTLTAGSECTVTITFKPSAAGTRAAALTIASNAPSSPDAVQLTGTGKLVAPVAYDLTLTTYENQALGGTLPASGPNGDPLTFALTGGPGHGSVNVTATTGVFTYTPTSGYHGLDSFSFTATDTVTHQVSNTATVSLSVNPTPPPNQVAPVASNLDLTTYENQTITGTLPAVVTPASDALNFTATQPVHGTVTITNTATGAFTYTPATGFSSGDTFTFTATDTVTNLPSNTATVNITVKATPPPNQVAPVASNLNLTTYENQTITGTLPAVVTPASDALNFTATQPAHGTVTITNAATGAFTYTPATGFSSGDTFSFTATDTVTNLPSNTATVNITVNPTPPPNAVPPVANGIALTTFENQAIAGTLPASVTPDTDTLSFTATAAAHGTVNVTDAATGAFTYTPNSGYSGSDSFSFTAKDTVTGLTSNTATVNITVNPTPPPNAVAPVATDLALTGYANQSLSGQLPAAVTPASDALAFAIGTKPAHGTVKLSDAATGAFTYTPAAGFHGTDTFSFTAKDTVTGLISNTATVKLIVNPTPPPDAVPPTAGGLQLTVFVNVAIGGTLSASVTPADDPLVFALATEPAHGSVTFTNTATGAFTYTPASNYVGPDNFSFTATDTATGLTSNVAVVSVQVQSVPLPPPLNGGGGAWGMLGLLLLAALASLAIFVKRRRRRNFL